MVSFSGTAAITNRMATVTINDLQCGVTYNITAEGALNGKLVGPRSSHGKIAAGPCPCPVTASECTYKYEIHDQSYSYIHDIHCNQALAIILLMYSMQFHKLQDFKLKVQSL